MAKENAISTLKGLKFDDIKALVEAEMTRWVKIRNRVYISELRNSVNSIVASIQKKIQEL